MKKVHKNVHSIIQETLKVLISVVDPDPHRSALIFVGWIRTFLLNSSGLRSTYQSNIITLLHKFREISQSSLEK